MEDFASRKERDDLETLMPVRFKDVPGWLSKLPHNERAEFLEVGLALAAAHYGLAQVGSPQP
jgi:hypothetical protein